MYGWRIFCPKTFLTTRSFLTDEFYLVHIYRWHTICVQLFVGYLGPPVARLPILIEISVWVSAPCGAVSGRRFTVLLVYPRFFVVVNVWKES